VPILLVLLFFVFRSSGEQGLVLRKDDHTYLASSPATTTHEQSQPLPFRQNVGNNFTEC